MKQYLSLLLLLSFAMADAVEFDPLGLSFDDVLLVPQHSPVASRRDISTRTRLTKNIGLEAPIISSNMDTVTENEMAIAMAQHGGIGIIHRFNTIEQEVAEVQKVKRYRNAVITDPLTIAPDATLADARTIMQEHNIRGLLVVDANNILVGILTSRDIRFRPPENTPISELMTPKEKLIVGEVGITIPQAKELLIKHRIEKLPIVHPNGTVAGLITGKDIYKKAEYPHASVDAQDRLLVGAAIGVKDDFLERATELVKSEVDVLVVDIAHGHSDLAINAIKTIRKSFPDINIIAGNVATAAGTHALIEAGADAVKVGVGPGSICTTRITTGSGYPQLSAIINCAQEAQKYDVPIIADGGIRYSGDITKAIAGGASTVMLGSLLAGTDESPGFTLVKNGKRVKVIRGMASLGANLGRSAKINKKANAIDYVPEGVEAIKPYKGSVIETLHQLIGGLRSGMSYCGATTIEQLCGNGHFVQITAAGVRESHSHDVQQVG